MLTLGETIAAMQMKIEHREFEILGLNQQLNDHGTIIQDLRQEIARLEAVNAELIATATHLVQVHDHGKMATTLSHRSAAWEAVRAALAKASPATDSGRASNEPTQ